jgi:altronate dehydratase
VKKKTYLNAEGFVQVMGIGTQINQLFELKEFQVWINSVKILYLQNSGMKAQIRDTLNKKLEGMMNEIEERIE